MLKVASTRDLGLLFTENNVKMIGQDGAYSIPINDREALWVFGDTFVGTFDEMGRRLIERMPNNTGLICRSKDAATGLTDFSYVTDATGELRQLVPLSPDEDPSVHRIWPMHGCCIDGKVYLYYIRVKILPEGQWPYKFAVEGSGMTVANYPELIFQRVVDQGSPIFWHQDEPLFGVAVLPVKAEGFVYVYGSYYKDWKHYCALARVPFDSLGYISYYEYLISSKPEWSVDRSKAISIMEGMPTELSVSYNAYLGCYLAVHSWETTGKVVGRTAPHPWGPWSEPTVLWIPKAPLRNPLVYNGPLVYAGKEHPELAKENGRVIYLTCVEFEEYYPRLIEVTLA